ncbi:MAG TPA: efflux transporter outer membrane subunit [Steroidobacter sp.]|uniref:efflux transporter outer membrane subunit n=1 Tax=Steroidobacter sp. TaxID=1978227 RepID=UPI002ED87F7D
MGSRHVFALLVTVGAAGCALAPPPGREQIASKALPNMNVPSNWSSPAAAGAVASGWVTQFDEPRLQALIADALEFNTDLRAAAARVEAAAAYIRIAGGELYPAVTGLYREGDESGAGIDATYVRAAWELDVWGRIRYGVRSARDEHAAAQEEYDFARSSLAALVIKSWFLVTEATLQRQLLTEIVNSSTSLVQFSEERARIGIGSDFDVSSARVSLESYRDSLAQVELSRQQAIRALELLVGRYPAAELEAAQSLPEIAGSTPAGLPSELLERRPDIVAAQRRVDAAFNLVQEARAARLPSISISGTGSHLSSDLFILQDRDDVEWSAGGTILAPLFRGGALAAQVRVRTAEQDAAIAAFGTTVLKAFSEVEDALSSERSMQQREAILTTAATEAERAVGFAQTRYRVGAGDLRAVQQQQLSYHSTRMSLLRVQSERRVQRVNLHLALGGDFEPS